VKQYYPALTGLRAIAALLVFIYHAIPVVGMEGTNVVETWLIRVAQQGYVGVNIFFVLSGFLITNRYYHHLDRTGPWLFRYLQNRFARIYPIYFLLTAVTFAVMVLRPTNEWYEWPATSSLGFKIAAVVLNLTLLRAYFEQLSLLGVPTAWTLTVEETFYLCAPFLLLGLKRNLRWIYIYPVLLFLLGTVLVAFCSRFLPYKGLMASMNFMTSNTFFGRCVEFLVGMGLAIWIAQRPPLVPARAGRGLATWLGVGGLLAGMVAMALIEHVLPAESLPWLLSMRTVTNLLLPFPIAALLWGLLHERSGLLLLLQSKAFDLLGKSSYVFYLLHLGVVDSLFSHYVSAHWLARLVSYTLLSIALYRGVERPLHLKLKAKDLPLAKSGAPEPNRSAPDEAVTASVHASNDFAR